MMKRFRQLNLSRVSRGVTLLEIMLVLAVAAMIIVMSVRYYQSATANQQANAVLQEIQAITAIADGVAQGNTRYSAVTQSSISQLMPNQSLATPWGSTITVKSGNASSYSVSIPNAPTAVCNQIPPRLQTNAKFSGATCSNNTISYTYDATKG